ncbi:hypothetical protein [Yinghuangia sp. YIM S09857]|uniref:hypothetical protein n=1 Tax=Yinghuangia sp. YIM S09857 TaxID=3436929 RepID=UPI003F53BE24
MDDNRWRAAQAAREPVVEGLTHSGLPRRMPQANLVPGAAVDAVPGLAGGIPLGMSRDPQDVRTRLDSFVQGREQARSGAEPPLPAVPPNPMTAPSPLATAPVQTPLSNKPVQPAEPTPRRAPATPRAPRVPAARKPQQPRAPKPTPNPAPATPDEPWGDGWKTFRPGQ